LAKTAVISWESKGSVARFPLVIISISRVIFWRKYWLPSELGSNTTTSTSSLSDSEAHWRISPEQANVPWGTWSLRLVW